MKMKVLLGFHLWVMILVVVMVSGTAFLFPAFTTLTTSSSTPGMNSPMTGNSMKGAQSIRKLQGSYTPSTEERKRNLGNLNLADYHQIDPSPSSRAAITTGPIEHGTPIIPYIPKVPPPSPPFQDVTHILEHSSKLAGPRASRWR